MPRVQLSTLFAALVYCAFAALLLNNNVVSATMNCISYEPFSNPNYPGKIYDALYGDLDLIKKQGFPCIKTYYSQYYGLSPAEVANNMGLKIVLGVRFEAGDILNAEVEAAIQACNKYPDTVLAIYIGNENLPAANAKDMIAVRNRIKERCSKPIGTVQTLAYWLNKPAVNWELFWAMDWWGYNAYSFFGPLGGKTSVDAIKDQIGQLQRAYPDVFDRFRLTETGWPSEGGVSVGNVANWNNAKFFADGIADMLCKDGEIKGPWMSYFIYNDPAYKKNVPEFERHFGVASPTGVPKWDLSRLAHCGSTWSDQENQTFKRNYTAVAERAAGARGVAAPQDTNQKYAATTASSSHMGPSRHSLKKVAAAVGKLLDDGSGSVTATATTNLTGGASKVQIYNACFFDVTADLYTPQPSGSQVVPARQWREIWLNEGNAGWVWKLYVNGQLSKPIQYEFTYKDGKLWYDLSLIDSFGGELEKNAMTLTCSDPNCHPKPNCAWTRCPSAYNADGSKACTIYQVYYPDHKCCYPNEPSFAAAGGSTITLTLC